MGLRKAMGIILVATQFVVAVDYNMQSHKAGLGPGELSMKDYFAIVQTRYDKPDNRLAAIVGAPQDSGLGNNADHSTSLGEHLSAGQEQDEGAADIPAVVVNKGLNDQAASDKGCVRRAGVLSCN
ncbi:hypothetical protein A9Q94_00920 [Rhodobacterales bacterium 56_14_T64]|nr:hypothetical protein A9Q94_00920 [Rhodobacterales bacterium 56_14_T64]